MSDSVVPDEGEHLTTGWERDLDPADTLVRRAVLAHASWAAAVPEALGRAVRRTDRWSGGHVGDRGLLTNPVVVTRPLAPEEWAEVLAEE